MRNLCLVELNTNINDFLFITCINRIFLKYNLLISINKILLKLLVIFCLNHLCEMSTLTQFWGNSDEITNVSFCDGKMLLPQKLESHPVKMYHAIYRLQEFSMVLLKLRGSGVSLFNGELS